MNITDPVLLFLAELMSHAGVYAGFMALAVIAINTIVGAFSAGRLSIG